MEEEGTSGRGIGKVYVALGTVDNCLLLLLL
jgi:hypothetical protein